MPAGRRYASDAERAAARAFQKRAYARGKRHEQIYPGGIQQFINDGHRHEPPPARVLAERDRMLSQPATPNMLCLGDPPPGRRAIDQRGDHL